MVLAAALFLCAGAATQLAPTLAPATRPTAARPAEVETVAAACARLARASAGDLSNRDIALHACLKLVGALGRADGPGAANLIDVVGYQALPLTGELPEAPAKPVPRADIRALVAARQPLPLDILPVGRFVTVDREATRELFPAVAEWMLPTDWAVVIHPGLADKHWLKGRCCLVVRLRARKPSILGGHLFEQLSGE